MDLEQLKKDTKEILVDVLEKSRLRQGQILVLGMSSSEVAGGRIGTCTCLTCIPTEVSPMSNPA